MDVSAAVTAITDGSAAVVAIGVAALTVIGGAMVFSYIKRAF